MRTPARLAAVLCLALVTTAGAASVDIDRFTYATRDAEDYPVAIGAGATGDVWVVHGDTSIARVTPNGKGEITEPLSEARMSGGDAVAAGDDGSMWVAASALYKVSPAGDAVPVDIGDGVPGPLAVDPDGNLWWADTAHDDARRLDVATGKVRTFELPRAVPPVGIASTPDGAIWVGGGHRIARVEPDGEVTQVDAGGVVKDVTAGPRGKVWYTVEFRPPNRHHYAVMAMNARMKRRAYRLPGRAYAGRITPGPNGNAVWVLSGEGVLRLSHKGRFTRYPYTTGRNEITEDLAFDRRGRLWISEWYDRPSGAVLGLLRLNLPG